MSCEIMAVPTERMMFIRSIIHVYSSYRVLVYAVALVFWD